MSTVPLRRFNPTIAALTATIVFAWAFALWAEQNGVAGALHHDALYRNTRPLWVSALLLLASWQTLIRYFLDASRDVPGRGAALTLFLMAYFFVWTAFALVAFTGDMALHRIVESRPSLDLHPQIISATLAAAALYQLTPLKDACLRACRHPAAYLLRHYRRGALGGWRLGFGHGLFCVGCCWALMLVMFAVGVAHLAWMGTLALIMLIEKTLPAGHRLARPIGAAIAALALVALLRPGAVSGL